MDDQFVAFLRSVSESRISPSGVVPRSYASCDGFLVEVKAIRSEYITMRFTAPAPDGRAVIALIPRELWGSTDPNVMLIAEDVRQSVIRTIRASKDRQMGVRVTNSRSASGDDMEIVMGRAIPVVGGFMGFHLCRWVRTQQISPGPQDTQ
ncbi:hypothetical protein B0J17DRAFT_712880 [Rhizoctonia solani]|nr:hypothetical protein B0J17DRAFT_712880 [Rhizoctonia solani]